MSTKLNPAVNATTLSVLLSENDSITCYIELEGEYTKESANVSLNLEQDNARLLGFPQSWGVHDFPIDQYDSGSPTYQEWVEEAGEELDEMPVYVSKETEAEILSQLKTALKKQFKDEHFKDQLSDDQKETALSKIDSAIKALVG